MDVELALQHRAQVEEFRRKHRTGLLTLLFTDIVGSTALKQGLGDREAATLFQDYRALVRSQRAQFSDSEEIETAGDSFLLVFATPSQAVEFALILKAQLESWSKTRGIGLQQRVGVHLGEVVIEEHAGAGKAKDLYGGTLDVCARVMSLAGANQILMTRAVFDNARQLLKGEDLPEVGPLKWLNHGPYQFKGLEEPIEVCEVRAGAVGPVTPPTSTEKAQRVAAEGELVLGWRPAIGQEVPNTKWVLEEKLGEGGFGEVWLAKHQRLKEQRVFKFCFRADRVRSLKREVTLFRLLKERIGEHPNIVRLYDVFFDEPPFHLAEEYVAGKDLRSWCEAKGGVEKVPLEVRLEIAAQAADGLQAAHDAGVIHRDVKPGNILVENPKSEIRNPKLIQAKLTDFGIGQVLSEEYLSGITGAGFTQTMMGPGTSSQTGTQLYMAPELFAGKPASIRSDIYSLGVVLYQLLVGDFTRPVTTDWAIDIVDPLLRDDLKHCFAGNPEDRFPGAGGLARNIRTLSERHAGVARQQAELAARERAAYRRGMIRTGAMATFIVAAVTVLAAYALRQAKLADRNASLATLQAQRAEEQRERAEHAATLLRRNIYAADMNVAYHAFEESNLGRVLELVEKHLPKAGEEDLRGFEWSYLWERSRGDALFSFSPHDSAATAVAFSPDGDILATGSFDQTVRIWNVRSRNQVRVLGPFPNVVNRCALAFSAKSDLLALARLGEIIVWNTQTWTEPRRLPDSGCAGTDDACPICFSSDGKQLAARVPEGVALWNLDSGTNRVIRGEGPAFGDRLAFFSDDSTLVIANGENVELWNTRTLTREAHLGGKGTIVGLAVAQKTKFVAVGRVDGVVTVWNVAEPLSAYSIKAHARFVFGIAFAPDGQTLATGGADQLIHLWNARSIIAGPSLTGLPQSVSNAQPSSTFRGHGSQVWALAFSPNGQTLASACKDGEVKLWDAQPKTAESELKEARLPFWFSPDGRRLLTVNFDHRLYIWDLATGTPSGIPEVSGGDAELQLPTVSADGTTMAFAKSDGTIELWDLIERKKMNKTPKYRGAIGNLKLSRDGKWLAIAGEQGSAVWNLASDRLQSSRDDVRGWSVDFSPDGTRLAAPSTATKSVASTKDTAQVWDVATSKVLLLLTGHKINVLSVVFSPNGQLVATGGHDNSIRIWDATTGEERFVLKSHLTAVSALAFSPEGRTLASGGSDGTLKLWHVKTGQEMSSKQFSSSAVTRLVFSPAGDALAIGFADASASIHLWRAKPLAEIDASIATTAKAK